MANTDRQDEKGAEPSPPTISYKTLKAFIAALKVGIPARIDRSVMPSYSGAVQAQVLATLRYFGLVDQKGHPQPKLAALVNSEGAERQRLLGELATAGYPYLFSGDIDLGRASLAQLTEQFNKRASGDSVRKAMGFLLQLLSDAGIAVSPHIKGRARRNGIARPRRQKQATGSAQPNSSPTASVGSEQQGSVMGWAELLLSKFPSFDPAWPDEVKNRWFESFEKLMASGGKKE